MNAGASEVSQGAMAVVGGGALLAWGIHRGSTWMIVAGFAVAAFGANRWYTNGMLANPSRPATAAKPPSGAVSLIMTTSLVPPPPIDERSAARARGELFDQ